ncbi:ZIP family metal transporter [Achromobacter sp.]|uniref:ZIP family metal transporter n=1 Tax=Achromobacter sp. TaxID=134375 RepID=UPI00390CCB8B
MPRPAVQDGQTLPAPRASMLKSLLGTCLLVLAAFGVFVLWRYLNTSHPAVGAALLGGLLAAGATALGALPVAFSQRVPERVQDTLLGFGAGIMLAACAFSLIIPGLDAARDLGRGPWGAGLSIAGAILLGALALLVLDRVLPHEHFIKGKEGKPARNLRRTWLFVFAITLHNFPEGLAIGVGYAGADPVQAGSLAMGIAIQDVPEGLVVAIALLAAGYRRAFAVGFGMASGLVEPLGAVLGAAIVGWSASLLPWGLGFAAGAMLFVISHEIIPETHRKGHEVPATCGLMLGFVLMMLLDTALQ